ncbi:hypothetical protein HAP94_18260 [Acidithiobacillus ferrivorans]|nr:hypothetical protein [Acidithiobacillus ferrivorans]
MIDEIRNKIITALNQAGMHYNERWDAAEDAPREFDPLDYLNDFLATAIGVTGDYFEDNGESSSAFSILLDNRFLVRFNLNLHSYCDEDSDGNLSMDMEDLGEDPDAAIKAAYKTFNEEVTRVAMDAVWRVFHCTSAPNRDQSAQRAFYKDLAAAMHAGIDEQMQKLKCVTLDQSIEPPAGDMDHLLVPEDIPGLALDKPLRRSDNLADIPYLGRTSRGLIISEDEAGQAFSPDERDLENIPE